MGSRCVDQLHPNAFLVRSPGSGSNCLNPAKDQGTPWQRRPGGRYGWSSVQRGQRRNRSDRVV